MAFLAAFINRQFITEPPIPTTSYSGKTVIVTGASSGLGLEACRRIIELGGQKVIIACRNTEKGESAAKNIQETTSCSHETIEVWHLDMSSYASVQEFSERVKKDLPRLDAVIANAGVQTTNFNTTEGNEETITTNVISTFLLAFLLHPKLRESAAKFETETHFTVTASELYEVAKLKEQKSASGKLFATLSDKTTAVMSDRYNVSKLLQVFMIKQIAALSPLKSNNVVINCVAPGLCHSELHRDNDSAIVRGILGVVARKTEVGARTLVYGASAGKETHGEYLPDCKITPTKGLTGCDAGAELQNRIWEELQQILENIRPGVTSI